jgi:broad specificity phosphatase PhoE
VDHAVRGEAAYFDPRHLDSLLTPLGEEQARSCSLPQEVKLIACSPLRRAERTAQLLTKPAGVELLVVDSLREWPRGHSPNFKLGEPDGERWADGGPLETLEQLDERVEATREWLLARPEACIAVVGHGAFLRRLIHGGDAPEAAFLPHATPVRWELARS